MEHEEVGRITKELEDLLMTDNMHEPESAQLAAARELEDGLDTIEKPVRESRKKQPARTQRCDGLLAAFLVPVLIMVIIFIQRGIFPFGEESFLRTDMYHQYAPFFSEFQDKLKSGDHLLSIHLQDRLYHQQEFVFALHHNVQQTAI